MTTQSSTDDPWSRSQLFTLRVWYEQIETDKREVRIQVKHVLSGEMRYFRKWTQMTDYLTSKLDPSSTVASLS